MSESTRTPAYFEVLCVAVFLERPIFPHIAVHVVKSEGIRLAEADEARALVSLRVSPGFIGVLFPVAVVGGVVSERPQGGSAGPTGILPLRLGRQSVLPALFCAEPFAERRAVVPTQLQHRFVVVRLEQRLAPGVLLEVAGFALLDLGFRDRHVAGRRGELSELRQGDFRGPHVKRLGDAHAMGRHEQPRPGQSLSVPWGRFLSAEHVFHLLLGHPHAEFARRQEHHLHADGVRMD